MFTAELISKLLLASFSYAWDNRIWETVDSRLKQVVYETSSHYQDDFKERYGRIRISGTNIERNIEDIYVQLYCQDPDNRSVAVNISDSIWHRYSSQDLNYLNGYRYSLFEQVNSYQYLILFGGVGSGKTISLKYLALEALRQGAGCRYQHSKIPVYLDFNNYSHRGKRILDMLISELLISDVPNADGFADATLTKGDFLILLDGVDELDPAEKLERLMEVRDFVESFPGNRYIIARREDIGTKNLLGFHHTHIQPFSEAEIEAFLNGWFAARSSSFGSLILRMLKRSILFPLDFLGNPLLITRIMIMLANSNFSLSNITAIYEKVLKILLIDWPREQGDESSDDLAYLREEFLSELALKSYFNFEPSLFKAEIIEVFEKQNYQSMSNPTQLLYDFQYKYGFLATQSDGSYKFTYQSVREYLAAYKFVLSRQYLRESLGVLILNEKWQNIFILSAGIKNADYLISTMLDHANLKLITPRFYRNITWLQNVTSGTGRTVRDVKARAHILHFLWYVVVLYGDEFKFTKTLFECSSKMVTLYHDEELYSIEQQPIEPKLVNYLDEKALVNISRRLIRRMMDYSTTIGPENLEKLDITFSRLINLIENPNMGAIDRVKLKKYIYHAWLNILRVEQKDVEYSFDDIESIQHYMYVYGLIIKCKNYARQVSTQLIYRIDHSFLTADSSVRH